MHQTQLPHNHGQNLEQMLPDFPELEEFAASAEMFRQLGDGTRLRLFWILCHCRECVLNLSVMMGMSPPAVSHHLKLLKAAGLITGQREGKEVYYTALDNPACKLLHDAMEALLQITCPWQDRKE